LGTDQPALLRPAGLLLVALLAAGAVQPAAVARKLTPARKGAKSTTTSKVTSPTASPKPSPAAGATVDRDEDQPNGDLIREALRQRGKPYIWGGASRRGFDCSGFMVYLFKIKRNIALPHSARGQSLLGKPVSRGSLQAGDLLFFSTYRSGISHVGMYLGENRFIHAANSRKDVRIDSLTGYYANRFRTARRLVETPIDFSEQEIKAYTDEPSVVPVSLR